MSLLSTQKDVLEKQILLPILFGQDIEKHRNRKSFNVANFDSVHDVWFLQRIEKLPIMAKSDKALKSRNKKLQGAKSNLSNERWASDILSLAFYFAKKRVLESLSIHELLDNIEDKAYAIRGFTNTKSAYIFYDKYKLSDIFEPKLLFNFLQALDKGRGPLIKEFNEASPLAQDTIFNLAQDTIFNLDKNKYIVKGNSGNHNKNARYTLSKVPFLELIKIVEHVKRIDIVTKHPMYEKLRETNQAILSNLEFDDSHDKIIFKLHELSRKQALDTQDS